VVHSLSLSLSIFLFPFFCLVYFSFLLYLACIVFANCIFGAASIDEPQDFSGSPPVVFTMY